MTVKSSHTPTAPGVNGARRILRERRAEMDITICEYSGLRELHITVRPLADETPSHMLRRLAAVLKEYDATVVRQELFGSIAVHDEAIRTLESVFGAIGWPINWIEGGGTGQVCGTHVFALSNAAIQPVRIDGKVVGSIYSDQSARHCVLGNLVATNINDNPARQTEKIYDSVEKELAAAGMTVRDIVRTWFFLDHILDWYGDFNLVRNNFYARQNPKPKCFPASTGISGRNPDGSALSLAVWGMQPLTPDAYFAEVLSPLQCPAPEYGSGFSRAAEIVTPEYRRLFVSGTASILPGGQSAHPHDIDGQIELTMEVVDAILRSRRLCFGDVTRATLYFKNIAQAPAFQRWLAKKNLAGFPAIATEAHVCRDELLFEIELDAMNVTECGKTP